MSTPAPDGDELPRADRPRRGDRWVDAAALVAVLLVGMAVGFISTLEATALLRIGPVHLAVGALIAGVANAVLGTAAAWGLRSRDATLVPAVGWFIVVLVSIFGPHPGGDIVLPGSGWDVGAFIVVGFAGAFLATVAVARGAAGALPLRGRAGQRVLPGLPPSDQSGRPASPQRPPDR